MDNNLIVTYMTEDGDLKSQFFATRENALDFIESTEMKCILITAENATVEVEYYT